ncbi:hypothetical protein M011DRAFT_476039 [Sporormia fimetaria CBS 119925]|uniref:RING-type domain-containing protein n=1 Tax=Sporormia fimetaria CBS 119925 TaxID=1340428 RepID=A0A6A6VDF6_9PLEO|nr:hypothetical protein M011DRAFT_476039 [Sporormia fimetaria CBS 119925]
MANNDPPFESRTTFFEYLDNSKVDVTPGAKCDICHLTLTTSAPQVLQQAATSAEDHEVAVQLPCTHIFGRNCIETWKRQTPTPTCPMCRTVLYLTPEEPLIFFTGVSSREIRTFREQFDAMFAGREEQIGEREMDMLWSEALMRYVSTVRLARPTSIEEEQSVARHVARVTMDGWAEPPIHEGCVRGVEKD